MHNDQCFCDYFEGMDTSCRPVHNFLYLLHLKATKDQASLRICVRAFITHSLDAAEEKKSLVELDTIEQCTKILCAATVQKTHIMQLVRAIDWLQSLKQFFINVSYHIVVASLTLMALFEPSE